MDEGYRGWGKSSSLSFLFRCSISFVTRFFLALVLYFIYFSFQTLLKGTFSLLTSHLQFSITARVSMILKRQSVQSLSDHKAAHTFCLSQERGILEQMVWSGTKRSFSLVWSRWGQRRGGGGGVSEWVRLGRESKNTSKKYDRNNIIR